MNGLQKNLAKLEVELASSEREAQAVANETKRLIIALENEKRTTESLRQQLANGSSTEQLQPSRELKEIESRERIIEKKKKELEDRERQLEKRRKDLDDKERSLDMSRSESAQVADLRQLFEKKEGEWHEVFERREAEWRARLEKKDQEMTERLQVANSNSQAPSPSRDKKLSSLEKELERIRITLKEREQEVIEQRNVASENVTKVQRLTQLLADKDDSQKTGGSLQVDSSVCFFSFWFVF